MFPRDFADHVIDTYTKPGDKVLDPFAGRGTSIYSAVTKGRSGTGIEINPVGWVYAKAKTSPANESDVLGRLAEIVLASTRFGKTIETLPVFYQWCFAPNVNRFLCAARKLLNWRRDKTDWTLMAIILIYLHGKRNSSLSNQMRQTKSMSPKYAIRWWKKRNMKPPEVNPKEFLSKKLKWRYQKGIPEMDEASIYLGDCNRVLSRLARYHYSGGVNQFHLMITSPPYCGVTNYHYDQWLRLWLLGFEPQAYVNRGVLRGKFINREAYSNLIRKSFQKASLLLNKDAIVYVRTDKRKFTFETTRQVLKEVFPDKKLKEIDAPFRSPTQTQLFGDHSKKMGEVDLILVP
jgi:hypothetical protein